MLNILIPSCTDEYLENCLDSMEISEPGSSGRVLVADNGITEPVRKRWPQVKFLELAKPFVFAKAINLCASGADQTADLLVLNDDTEIITPAWLTALESTLAHETSKEYGLLSLTVTGGVGNPEQKVKPADSALIKEAAKTIKFVAAAIRRKTWEQVGPLDERFVDYGFDDDDYSLRVKMSGWKTGVTQAVIVKHGAVGFPQSSTYLRLNGTEGFLKKMGSNEQLFREKWNIKS